MKEAWGLLGIKVKAVGKVLYSRFYLQIGGNIANNASDWISGEAKRRALTMNKFIPANIICTPPHTKKNPFRSRYIKPIYFLYPTTLPCLNQSIVPIKTINTKRAPTSSRTSGLIRLATTYSRTTAGSYYHRRLRA